MVTALRLRHLRRYGELGRLLVKYGRSDLADQVQFDGLDPTADADVPPAEAEELADDLERLGPTFVKLGQLLSTRPDILPSAYTKALSRLQDDIAPMPLVEVEQVVREDLGMTPGELFDHFEPEPLASASIGQVHRAITRDGRAVAVKVQYPGVGDAIKVDLDNAGLSEAVVRSITEIAHVLGKLAVAEQAETESQLQQLREIGVDYAQGYVFQRPQPVDLFFGEASA